MKGIVATRSEIGPKSYGTFEKQAPSRFEVRGRPNVGTSLESTSFPGSLLISVTEEGKGATIWPITSTFGTEILISFFLSSKSRTCQYLCTWNDPAGVRNAQA